MEVLASSLPPEANIRCVWEGSEGVWSGRVGIDGGLQAAKQAPRDAQLGRGGDKYKSRRTREARTGLYRVFVRESVVDGICDATPATCSEDGLAWTAGRSEHVRASGCVGTHVQYLSGGTLRGIVMANSEDGVDTCLINVANRPIARQHLLLRLVREGGVGVKYPTPSRLVPVLPCVGGSRAAPLS